MAGLVDVNVLVALATSSHTHSAAAAAWFENVPPGEAVVCRVAQLGLLRILNNHTRFPELAFSGIDCWNTWLTLKSDERVAFAPGEPTGIESELERVLATHSMTAKRWTDAYPAAFAAAAGHRMITFDRGFRAFAGVDVELLA